MPTWRVTGDPAEIVRKTGRSIVVIGDTTKEKLTPKKVKSLRQRGVTVVKVDEKK